MYYDDKGIIPNAKQTKAIGEFATHKFSEDLQGFLDTYLAKSTQDLSNLTHALTTKASEERYHLDMG